MADNGIFVPPAPRKSGPPTISGLSMAQAQHEAKEEMIRQSTLAPTAEEVMDAATEVIPVPPPPQKAAENVLENFPGPDEHDCRRCGFPRINAMTDMQPTQAEKDEFWRHILGAPRFKRTYRGLLGGRLEITLRTRTVEESDVLGDMFRKELEGLSSVWRLTQSEHQLDFRKTRLMLCASLEQVVVRFKKGEEGKVHEFKELTDLSDRAILERARLIQKTFPAEVTYAVLTTCLRHFEQFCRLMNARVADPSFFGEIDAGS